MIGQEKLLCKLNKYTLTTLPKSILFIGKSGSGKHTISKMLADKFNLETITINENISSDELLDYSHCPIDRLYVIDIDMFLEDKQQQFLKFIEEPSDTVHIILLAESEINIIETILNRCIIYHMEEYTIEQLKQIKIVNNDTIYTICNTPGQLLLTDEKSFEEACELCNFILSKISTTDYADMLYLYLFINCKDEENYDKVNFNLFFKLILYLSFNNYIINNDIVSLAIYNFTAKYISNLKRKTLKKEHFIINYLLHLKEEVMNYAA